MAAIARREPLIYGGPLSVAELLGEPDLLRLEAAGNAATDIKSGAWGEGSEESDDDEGKPKKSYGVQIALYTDILTRLGVSAGRYGYIWDVLRVEKRYELDAPLGPRSPWLAEIYLEARHAVERTLTEERATRPVASSGCKQCVWRSSCLRELKDCQDLTLLPELGRARRDALIAQFHSLSDLAHAEVERFVDGKKADFPGVGPGMLRKFKVRAQLATSPNPVPFLTRPVDWPAAPVELCFDIETDPMRDLCYLHGFVVRKGRDSKTERFEGIYAQDLTPETERDAFAAAMKIFRQYPDAVIMHYSKYERTVYRKLCRKYPGVATQEEIEALFSPPRALDSYLDVVRSGSEWPTLDF